MARITKNQAIEMVGSKAVEAAMNGGCDFTNRVTDGTAWQGYTEFSFAVNAKDSDGDDVTLIAYWFMDSAEVEAADDLSSLNLEEPDNYEVI